MGRVSGQGSRSGVTCQRSSVIGQGSLIRGHWSLDSRSLVRDQSHRIGVTVRDHRSEVKRHRSRVSGQGSVSRVSVQGSWSGVTGQRSVVKFHWSEVTSQSQESLVKGHWSTIFYHQTLYESGPAEGLEVMIF